MGKRKMSAKENWKEGGNERREAFHGVLRKKAGLDDSKLKM